MKIYLTAISLLLAFYCQAQGMLGGMLLGKKTWYASWGYHRSWFGKSDLNFRNANVNENQDASGNYDFVIYGAKAQDRPNFEQIPDIINFTIPQFNAKIGFVSNYKGLGLEMSYDHAKYVVTDYQNLRVKGNLFGKSIDTQMVIDPNSFVHLEHTDGANLWMLAVTLNKPLIKYKKRSLLDGIFKAGGGVVVPRTDVAFMGSRTNNRFHFAGYVYGAEAGLQLNITKRIFSTLSGKYAMAYFTNARVSRDPNAYVTHHFNAYLAMFMVGYRFI